jgi:FecR protein
VSDDYLWGKTGKPEPEIQRLETLLGRFRHRRETMEVPAFVYLPKEARTHWALWVAGVVAAVAIVAIFVVVWLPHWRTAPTGISEQGWTVERMAGVPELGNRALAKNGAATLRVGQTLETDSHSRARISISATGEIQVDPDSKVRLVASTPARKRLALEFGTIHAMIWAPPGEFVVATPSATAVDLGCAYTLHVDGSGAGLLRTTFGWVGFKFAGRESLVPAGAVCLIRPHVGPGTPYFDDTSKPFQQALAKLDFGSGTPEQRTAELSIVLSEARKRDALTLWHLLSRVNEAERIRVYDRLAQLVPPPPHVTRAGVLHLDRQMLDLWWNEFNLGDMSLWQAWERSWPEEK